MIRFIDKGTRTNLDFHTVEKRFIDDVRHGDQITYYSYFLFMTFLIFLLLQEQGQELPKQLEQALPIQLEQVLVLQQRLIMVLGLLEQEQQQLGQEQQLYL